MLLYNMMFAAAMLHGCLPHSNHHHRYRYGPSRLQLHFMQERVVTPSPRHLRVLVACTTLTNNCDHTWEFRCQQWVYHRALSWVPLRDVTVMKLVQSKKRVWCPVVPLRQQGVHNVLVFHLPRQQRLCFSVPSNVDPTGDHNFSGDGSWRQANPSFFSSVLVFVLD
ncbi:hypothetical protein B0H10DRAFT_654898 [Mycena sp. CBHHK59/15]|nr:hypothetical protein B0H10DRAFT_654898 [Mycena sp. CBHHK59/15]